MPLYSISEDSFRMTATAAQRMNQINQSSMIHTGGGPQAHALLDHHIEVRKSIGLAVADVLDVGRNISVNLLLQLGVDLRVLSDLDDDPLNCIPSGILTCNEKHIHVNCAMQFTRIGTKEK